MMNKRVVITGLGVITPVGNDVETFWHNITSGVCGIGPITRFDTQGFSATLAAEVKEFDAALYGITGPEARRMDLYTRYAVAAAEQAVRDSGFLNAAPCAQPSEAKLPTRSEQPTPSAQSKQPEQPPQPVPPERLGVYVGSGIGGIHTFATELHKLDERGPQRVSPFFVPMMIANIAAGTIALRYGAEGPTLPVVTACASSTNTLGEALRAIRHGYADLIIAGGAEAAVEPVAVAGFANSQALSLATNPKEASLPFDARRAGFVIGEGAGVLVLEEYEHARARGARMYAELCGYGNTCDAHHITAPREDAKGAARAIRLAAQEAGVTGEDSIYLNAHGTGTPLNDKTETLAIKLALGEEAARALLVSSTKSMTGHMLGAAGAVEAVASALALYHGCVPPTINLLEPDPDCDLDYVAGEARAAACNVAISNSFGFGGHNASIVMRRAR
jgi:3-oxoacyl-[acyl-carrier-protein] synthase II